MKKIILVLTLLFLLIISVIVYLTDKTTPQPEKALLKEKLMKVVNKPVDHRKFAVLQTHFSSPQEVTKACLSCHTERHKEVMSSNHWNWEREEFIEGRGVVYIGKKNVLNNYCIGSSGNEASCAKCHAGLGMTSDNFSFEAAEQIDCLICHDNSDTYLKASEKGGAPVATLNFSLIAQNVGKPTRSNCGVCHFFGGGGNNVKHGDLEEALFFPDKEIDIHMAVEGANLSCVDCHKTEEHNISGKMYSLSSMNENRVFCEDCHNQFPHAENILNEHTTKVACQTCHIPIYSKVAPTKTSWDWSTAGDLNNGEPYQLTDTSGNVTYLSTKGTFTWGDNIEPEYVWFNGTASHYILGDTVNGADSVVILNPLNGDYSDSRSKIIPVKIHRAMQPFDPVTRMIIQPKLVGKEKGDGSYWVDFNWIRASELGMQNVGLPFSGNVAFIHTEMYWPINHMVSSKDKALSCISCHTRNNSRIANLTGFYLPGRDYSKIVDYAGFSLIFLTLFAVGVHATFRIISNKKLKK